MGKEPQNGNLRRRLRHVKDGTFHSKLDPQVTDMPES